MKVKFMSDLHLEFGGPDFDPGHGEILILAGTSSVQGTFMEPILHPVHMVRITCVSLNG